MLFSSLAAFYKAVQQILMNYYFIFKKVRTVIYKQSLFKKNLEVLKTPKQQIHCIIEVIEDKDVLI